MKKLLLLTIVCLVSCMFCAAGAWGDVPLKVSCVSNAAELQAALTTAQSNSLDDIIQVVQGTYTGNFTYSSSESYGITLQGGYTAGCLARVVNPTNTILDGGTSGGVLSIISDNSSGVATGYITVDGFTIQHGAGATTFYGAGVRAYSHNMSTTGNMAANAVTITNNIVIQNSAVNTGGGVYASSQSANGAGGNVIVANNIIAGNIATKLYGGGLWADTYSGAGTTGTVTLTNNTITGNSAGGNGGEHILVSMPALEALSMSITTSSGEITPRQELTFM